MAPTPAGGDEGGLLFCSDSGRLFYTSPEIHDAAARGRADELPPAAADKLRAAGALVDRPIAHNRDYCDSVRASVRASTRLYAVIFTSSKCQLGCGYCGQRHDGSFQGDAMVGPTVGRIRAAVEARAGALRRLEIGWFGGEPLLGLRFMSEVSAELRRLADERRLRFTSRVPTNGLALTAEAARVLYEDCACRAVEITLDGPQEVHDRRRALKRGGPTFGAIFENLVAFAADPAYRDCRLTVRCNLDTQNLGAAYDLVDLLASRALQRRIALYFAPVRSWGNLNDIAATMLDRERYAEEEIRILLHMKRRGFRARLLPRPKPRGPCLTVSPEAEVIGPEGHIYKCTEHPLIPAYGPEVQVGRAADAGPTRALAGYTDWLELVESGQVPCSACPMFSVCGGACPKAWKEGEIPCPPAKLNIHERMRLVYEMDRERVRVMRHLVERHGVLELREHDGAAIGEGRETS